MLLPEPLSPRSVLRLFTTLPLVIGVSGILRPARGRFCPGSGRTTGGPSDREDDGYPPTRFGSWVEGEEELSSIFVRSSCFQLPYRARETTRGAPPRWMCWSSTVRCSALGGRGSNRTPHSRRVLRRAAGEGAACATHERRAQLLCSKRTTDLFFPFSFSAEAPEKNKRRERRSVTRRFATSSVPQIFFMW